MVFDFDIFTVGGCGRVGLPLSIAFAGKGLKVVVYDIDGKKISSVQKGIMPFLEEGCDERLKLLINKNLVATGDLSLLSRSRFVVITIGTPVEEHLNPQYSAMKRLFIDLMPHFTKGQYVVLRSTVYPGTTEKIHNLLKEHGVRVNLAFCPERIAEGRALCELEGLPQVVCAFDQETIWEVSKLFNLLTEEIVILKPIEGELAKLFTNVWRYIHFAIANQFYMIANQYGLDFYCIYGAMTHNYPRTRGLPGPGFTAGPCLFKDTMQLAAFNNNNFFLGHAAMLINEGLPNYIVQKLKEKVDLRNKKAGILGMTYKADCDDRRDSLSYKLKKILELEAKEVYCSDVYVPDDSFVSPEELLEKCDVVIVAAPHKEYKELKPGKDKLFVDVWNFFGRGGRI
ncbi:MAG: nucleotide sugar dehydrogenase [Peptococcaceae bacterium]|nr:MAG: nucleotide sugar dehydrogenase [Peptococcaceae bacterium]